MDISLTRRCAMVNGVLLTTAVALSGTRSIIPSARAGDQIGEVTWALPSVAETLLIPHAWTTYVGAIMSLVQEGLLTFGDDLSLELAAADTWNQENATTLHYHLRGGVTFGDGSPLTADDVVATMEYHMNPDSGSQLASFYNSVAAVKATAKDQVTVKLKGPDVQFVYTAAHMAGFVFKKEQLADNGIGTPEVLPLGTGPYRLAEFVPSDRVVLEARDDYWGGTPFAKRIVFQAIPDRQARLLAMQNGDIAGTFDIAISDLDQWDALGNVETTPSLGVYALILDQSAPPFDDIHVRRAVAHAVDREGLVKALLKGKGEAATALNPPQMWSGLMLPEEVRAFYATLAQYPFDLGLAKAELAKSGHPDGFDVSIPASSADPYMVNILQSVVENLKQIGIRARIEETDNNTWLAQYFRHEKLGMQIMAYYPDYPDAVSYPYLFFSSATARKDGLNGSNFKDAEVDALLKTATEKSDPTERTVALKKLFTIVNDKVPLVPIFWPNSAMALSNKYRLNGYTAFWYNVPWAMRGFGPAW